MSDDLHVYEVGIMSHTAKVRAPNALAAAIYYGAHTSGNMLCGAVVYTEDDEKYAGDMPWLRWLFGKEQPSEEQLEAIKADLERCRFMKGGKR